MTIFPKWVLLSLPTVSAGRVGLSFLYPVWRWQEEHGSIRLTKFLECRSVVQHLPSVRSNSQNTPCTHTKSAQKSKCTFEAPKDCFVSIKAQCTGSPAGLSASRNSPGLLSQHCGFIPRHLVGSGRGTNTFSRAASSFVTNLPIPLMCSPWPAADVFHLEMVK